MKAGAAFLFSLLLLVAAVGAQPAGDQGGSGLVINVISPQEKAFFILENDVGFVVKVSYTNGTRPAEANVTLIINKRHVPLYEAGAEGLYETVYNAKDEPFIQFYVTAEDAAGNSARTRLSGVIITYWGLNVMLVVFIMFFLLLIAVFWTRRRPDRVVERFVYGGPLPAEDRRSELSSSLKRLEARKTTLEKAKEAAERAYYKRTIDEKTFREMLEHYEEELIKVNIEIINAKRGFSR